MQSVFYKMTQSKSFRTTINSVFYKTTRRKHFGTKIDSCFYKEINLRKSCQDKKFCLSSQ